MVHAVLNVDQSNLDVGHLCLTKCAKRLTKNSLPSYQTLSTVIFPYTMLLEVRPTKSTLIRLKYILISFEESYIA
jgi:hypothetical protein